MHLQVDLVELWLTDMGISHSDSESTKQTYRRFFGRYLTFTKLTPEKILLDYKQNDQIIGNQIINKRQEVIHSHTQAIRLFMATLGEQGYLRASIQNAVHAVRSFYKYNNLPLENIQLGKRRVTLHNRDITKKEIEDIIKESSPRERAFYSLMVQSGLRPQTLCLLKIGDIEGVIEENPTMPALIKVSEEQTKGQYGSYWTFVGKESMDYLKDYLKRRNQPLNVEEYLFTHDKSDATPINTDIISHIFRRTVLKLKKEGVMDFKNKTTVKANRNEIRLYNLRKYFRNHAGSGADFVNFWMGHIAKLGVDASYFSVNDNKENIERHRKVYADTALKNLRLESKTPNQAEEDIIRYHDELKELKSKYNQILEAVITQDKKRLELLKQEELELHEPIEPTKEELQEIQGIEGSYVDDVPMSEEERLADENEYLKARVDELAGDVVHIQGELDEIKSLVKALLSK